MNILRDTFWLFKQQKNYKYFCFSIIFLYRKIDIHLTILLRYLVYLSLHKIENNVGGTINESHIKAHSQSWRIGALSDAHVYFFWTQVDDCCHVPLLLKFPIPHKRLSMRQFLKRNYVMLLICLF